uniref:(northern house mosquito) hypothetical protein n=1 Tax=Culex pipiens TaxID=7175 RepID=A0A8D8JKS5_CULPI
MSAVFQALADKSLKWLREEAARLGAPTSGNKAVLQIRVANYQNNALNTSLIEVPAVVPPLDSTPFADVPPYEEMDDTLRKELEKWLTVVKIHDYFEKRNALNSYNNGRLLLKDRFLENICYARVCIYILTLSLLA